MPFNKLCVEPYNFPSVRSCLHGVDLLEESESLGLLTLRYCGLDYTQLLVPCRCVSRELQHVRGAATASRSPL